jgi:hypothetical protein
MGYGVADSETRRAGWGAGHGRRFRGNVGNVEGRGAVWLVREAAHEYGRDAVDSGLASDRELVADHAGAHADRLLELADEIVVLSAHIQAAMARLLELVAEFDRLGGWRVDGHRR